MPTASSSKPAREVKKPYDRALTSSYTSLKGKGPKDKDLGAPATHGQKTRKGKKAWRKNIDVRDEEEALEQAREEERVTG
jgi:nucleolar protein 53